MILKLVTDGINLAPQNPTFIQARDAIILADQLRYGSANKPELWAAFAKRGLGQGASTSGNTSSTITESSVVPTFGYVWAHATGPIYSSPAVATDGTIYFGSDDKRVRALNSDGSIKANYTATGSYGAFGSSPAIASDGTVYIGCSDGRLYVFTSNLALLRYYQTGGEVFSSPAIGPDNSVYFGSLDGKVYAYTSTGAQKWGGPKLTGNTVYASPAIYNGTVYIASSDGKVYAYDAATGGTKTGFPVTTGGSIFSSPAVDGTGTIYVGSYDSKVYAIDSSGVTKWTVLTGAPVRSVPAIGASAVYVGSQDWKLYALNPANGAAVWTPFLTGYPVDSSAAIGSDGTIIFGSNDNVVRGLNSNGTLTWQVSCWGKVFSSPVIAPNGRIYVASAGADLGVLYCLDKGLTGASSTAPWPMFRKNARRTGS